VKTLSLLFLSVLVSLSTPAFGLKPYLVKDINTVPEPANSWPASFVTLGSVALFQASDGITGEELWRSDGTAAGTWQVADLCQPSACGSISEGFALTSRHYFFRILDESLSWNLWATDGTPAGTVQLTSSPLYAFGDGLSVGDVLYFNVSIDLGEDDYADELWRSDGTPAGTWRVSDQSPYSMVAFQGSVYFTGDDGALWKTDGTPAGTARAASLPGNRRAAALFVVGSRLVFKVFINTPGGGAELWSSDGTAEGTRVLSDALWFPYFSVQGGRLYFVAEDDEDGQELWVTDGTPQNTRALTRLPRRDAFYSQAQGYFLELPHAAAGNRFVFLANDGPHGPEPWVTDGTVEGTRLLKDFCPGFCADLTQVWDRTLPGLVFLTVTRRNRGNELWVTDGTEAGTHLVRDICPGRCDGHPYSPFVVKDRLLFAANDGESGDELWATGGTEADTVRISDFALELPWNEEIEGTVAGGQLLFDAPGPEGYELWRADGTGPSGTRLARDIDPSDVGGSNPIYLMALGGQLCFFTYSFETSDIALWKSDGTEAGTVQVRAFGPEDTDGLLSGGPVSAQAGGQLFFFLQSPRPSRAVMPWRTDGTEAGTWPLLGDGEWVHGEDPEMRAAGNKVFFAVEDMEHGRELWSSDGVSSGRAGTRLVRDVEPGTSGSDPAGLAEFQGKLYFSASTAALGRELWVSDGTEAGTDLVKAIQPGTGSNPSHLTVHANRLWFFADDGEHGRELWVSDGTRGGTAFAVDVEPGEGSFEPFLLISLSDRLLIYGRSPSQGYGIWATDGTAAGTRMISRELIDGYAVFQDRVWFASPGTDYFNYLWVTDGTEAGTVPVLDRGDAQPLSYPTRLAVLDGHLLFATWSFLWASDGTPAGTIPLAAPPGFEVHSNMVQAGSRVFFGGMGRETGVELWAVEEDAP
jgi:ELWxxDGT repeat protein